MRKNSKNNKNYSERRNISKLTALGLALALGATMGGNALADPVYTDGPAAGNRTITTNNFTNDASQTAINSYLTVNDDNSIFQFRTDWTTNAFDADIINTNDPNETHEVRWTNNPSQVHIQSASSTPSTVYISSAETGNPYLNVHMNIEQSAGTQGENATWKDVTITRSTSDSTNPATASVDLGTASDGYLSIPDGSAENTYAALGAPDAIHENVVPSLVAYHDFRTEFAIRLSATMNDVVANQARTNPARIIGNYELNRAYQVGTTTLTFNKRVYNG